MKKNIQSTRKFYRVILRHLEPRVSRYDVYKENPDLWLSIVLRVFPLRNPPPEVADLEKDLSQFTVGLKQLFLNQIVGKLRSTIDDDDGSDHYSGYDYFLSPEFQEYASNDLSWYHESFGVDKYTCILLRSIFRGELDIEWQTNKLETI